MIDMDNQFDNGFYGDQPQRPFTEKNEPEVPVQPVQLELAAHRLAAAPQESHGAVRHPADPDVLHRRTGVQQRERSNLQHDEDCRAPEKG